MINEGIESPPRDQSPPNLSCQVGQLPVGQAIGVDVELCHRVRAPTVTMVTVSIITSVAPPTMPTTSQAAIERVNSNRPDSRPEVTHGPLANAPAARATFTSTNPTSPRLGRPGCSASTTKPTRPRGPGWATPPVRSASTTSPPRSFATLWSLNCSRSGSLPGTGKTEPAADADTELLKAQENAELVLLAAVAYGEASTKDVYEEMAGIANVLVRQKTARSTTLANLLSKNSHYAFAASDGNADKGSQGCQTDRPAQKRRHAQPPESGQKRPRRKRHGLFQRRLLLGGADIKTNYADHAKVKPGIKFTNDEHNIYKIKESTVNVTRYWQVADKSGKLVNGKERGKYTYVYESTAAYGGTIFWKFNADYVKAEGSKEYQ